jgi:hypothetical protein
MAEESSGSSVEPETESGISYVDVEADQPVWQNIGGDH